MIVGTTIGGLKPKTKLTGEELIPFEQESENSILFVSNTNYKLQYQFTHAIY